MTGAFRLFVVRIATLMLAALSLGLSFAHLLEAPPRLHWAPDLWIAATVFGAQFALFGTLGAVIDVAAVAAALYLARVSRGRAGGEFALGGALLLGLGLIAWLGIVFPANQAMAGWTPAYAPDNFEAVRSRWETGHALIAGLKLTAFVSLLISALQETRAPQR